MIGVCEESSLFEHAALEYLAECASLYVMELLAGISDGQAIRTNLHCVVDTLYFSTFAAERIHGLQECEQKVLSASTRRNDNLSGWDRAIQKVVPLSTEEIDGDVSYVQRIAQNLDFTLTTYLPFIETELLVELIAECSILCMTLPESVALGADVTDDVQRLAGSLGGIIAHIVEQTSSGTLVYNDGILTRVTDGES